MSTKSATPPPPASTDVPAPKPERPSAGARLPSLNQLAARIGAKDGASSSSTTPSSRPRLAASLLRTGSTSSLTTSVASASTFDSTAVNAPTTRSTSPAALSTSPPDSKSSTPVPLDNLGEPLTAENLKELNLETEPTKKVKVGYKNIPSLDAITARLAKARTLSIDGSARPPEAETIEDPQTPGLRIKAPEHPLENKWTLYHDQKSAVPFTPATAQVEGTFSHTAPPESGDYEAGLTVVGEFDTVESFCRHFNWLKPPSKLERNSNYHLFKSGIKPMWEDEANAKGGKWVLTMKNNPALLDRCWSWLAMALVGEELDEGDEVCGAVVSLRSKVDRIQLWTRSKDDVERLNGIAKKLVKILDVSDADNIGLEFQYNTDDRPPLNKFLSIQSLPQSSFRSSFHGGTKFNSPVTGPGEVASPVGGAPVPGGAFAGFGVGGFGGASQWRGKRS
ncbi:translation initiation factor eIF4e [Neolentinus lepideus HHB14362 ss-1]|uniref:Translation initiation factor eIF4e n=1 Tax=Neolentinus lepideus HHB14362 ss-1 TaxID=1314782 RepID=A0A165MXY7_9AGAM|nr:translation initiation factor eIF4e [Neolentinus lepideus HHB14362 ss-1]